MTVLVTGSSGHLGEALMRVLRDVGRQARGVDVLASPFTDVVGSIADSAVVDDCMAGVRVVVHTATLHKPHVETHSRQDFVDTNVSGTLNLLEAARAAGVEAFVFTSTTSAFGSALTPPPGAPAAWVTEDVTPVPKNIYGVTKIAAEHLCELFHRLYGLPCVVLRTSRFFPEDDDNRAVRSAFGDANTKANEFLYRRVEIHDVVQAHLLAMEKARAIGFGRYIISATSPFGRDDLAELRRDAPAVVARYFPDFGALYGAANWRMFTEIGRVYVNERARRELGWRPAYDFSHVLTSLRRGADPRSPLARQIGAKGYHQRTFEDGPFPVAE